MLFNALINVNKWDLIEKCYQNLYLQAFFKNDFKDL